MAVSVVEIKINLLDNFIIKLHTSINIIEGFGCHCRGVSNVVVSESSPFGKISPERQREIATRFNFDPKLFKTSPGYETYNDTLWLIFNYGQAKAPDFFHKVRQEAFEKIYNMYLLNSYNLLFMTDAFYLSKNPLGTTEFVRWLIETRGYGCVASPVVGNRNYFLGDFPHLDQAWILINSMKNGDVAWDTSFKVNFGTDTFKQMKELLTKKKCDLTVVLGNTVKYFEKYWTNGF